MAGSRVLLAGAILELLQLVCTVQGSFLLTLGTCPACLHDNFGGYQCVSADGARFNPLGSLAGITTCDDAKPFVTCQGCSTGGGCACTKDCNPDPIFISPFQYDFGISCNCAPIGACEDPRLSKPPSLRREYNFHRSLWAHYDFHGLPDRDFNLISDQDLALNAHFIGQNGEETGFDGTWMSALGLIWTEGANERTAAITVKQGAAAFEDDVPFVFEIDGQAMPPSSFQAVNKQQQTTNKALYQDESLSITLPDLEFSQTITVKDHITVTVTAATHEHPTGNHIDIAIRTLNVTATVHGALGQTFAAARADALKAAAALAGSGPLEFDEADIVEGKDVDYMTSSLMSTHFMYNRFHPHAGAHEKVNVAARKLLSASDTDSARSEMLQGELSCKNKLGSGGIRCFK